MPIYVLPSFAPDLIAHSRCLKRVCFDDVPALLSQREHRKVRDCGTCGLRGPKKTNNSVACIPALVCRWVLLSVIYELGSFLEDGWGKKTQSIYIDIVT